MILATGDTHAGFKRFDMEKFPDQKEMTRKDIVLIAGDFGGVWAQTEPFPLIAERDRLKILENENARLDWLAEKNCTFCYVLGNHENWNRYDGDEFPAVDFYGGKAQRIRENVYHLMSGYVFDFDGFSVYAFDGAGSHDIWEGILDRSDYPDDQAFRTAYQDWRRQKIFFRVKDYTWWEREAKPGKEEIRRGWENLARFGNQVDLILTHCLPDSVQAVISKGMYGGDELTEYLQEVSDKVEFGHWISGHYHKNVTIQSKYHILYEQIVRLR